MTVTAVIMAGGRGERFWPRSRIKLPKQLLNITGEETMIQQTVNRLKGLVDIDNVYIVTNEDYVQIISQQLPEIKTGNILVEPMSRNTAACIGISALQIEQKDPDSVMVVIPSDHLIRKSEKFKSTIKSAIEMANEGPNIVTIGVIPTYAETGYGYINIGEEADLINNHKVFKVKKFVEKPDKKTAQQYIDNGSYFWNSGMIVLKVSTLLESIQKYMPGLHQALENIREAMDTEEEDKVLFEEYSKLESISIDYGILEKTNPIYVIPADFGWDDVGAWTSLDRIHEPDENGNVVQGNVLSLDTKKCIIQGTGNKLIAIMGLENVIAVDTPDVTLICSKDKAQNIKELINEVKKKNMEYYL